MVAAIRKIKNDPEVTDVMAGVRTIGELLPQVLARYRLPLPDAAWLENANNNSQDDRCLRAAK